MKGNTIITRKEFCKEVLCIEEPTDEVTQNLNELLKSLSDREERVIRLRYGLDDNRPRSLLEIAREFGLTRERIRQIESKAIKKLRHLWRFT